MSSAERTEIERLQEELAAARAEALGRLHHRIAQLESVIVELQETIAQLEETDAIRSSYRR